MFSTAIVLVLLLGQNRAAAEPAGNAPAPTWLPASPEKLPRWRGFNLLEKFQLGSKEAFREEDFRLIAKLGFNFVRLPMDYRVWIRDGDWEAFDEAQLREIDQAIAWAQKYGIHVWINFHRAPGYTVATPPESRDLWTDAEAQRVCAKHWATFARRYRGIPSERLAFNLFNEPGKIDPAAYIAVCRKMADAIRGEDPNRLIVADGLEWGRRPVLELRAFKIAEATRGYSPMELTHYRASWANGDRYPLPEWPIPTVNGLLAGPFKQKEGLGHPLTIEGPLGGSDLRLHVLTVSDRADLVVEADGRTILDKSFRPGPGTGEWKKSLLHPQWKVYQNLYDRDYTVTIPPGTKRLKLAVTAGDWLQLTELGLRPAGSSERRLPLHSDFQKSEPSTVRFQPESASEAFVASSMKDRAWLWQDGVKPWQDAEATGIGVMVGEWGAFNKTPHDVTLRWMEDCLANWHRAGWGWALWNFRGAFGVLDSDRKDVEYEQFEGHRLDRKMLDLLKRY